MNKRIIVFSLILTGLLFSANFAYAEESEPITLTSPIAASDFCQLFTSIATMIATLIGALGTIMIIVAAIFYLTSAGSPERIGVAKKTLIYAIIGIAIGISAGVIVEVIKDIIKAGGGSCGGASP